MYYPYNPRHINALLLLYNQYFLDIFLRMSRFYLFFLQKISFSMVNLKEVSSFCWDHLLAIFSGDRCMVFWIDWLHWFIRRRSHIFLNSCRNTLLSIKRIFTGWMNESSTHRTHSLGVFSDLLISVCRFNVHCFFSWQWYIHTEFKVITISESNQSETSFWMGKWICRLHSSHN